MATKRQQNMARTLRALAPLIPLDEAQAVMARCGQGSLRDVAASAAIWLALTSHVRHRHTDYDRLLAEGYDRDAARFFVADEMERQLTEWGCARPLSEEDD
ncbi:MAG: DUF2293 domain-containing protein [Bosea sp.]|jgi:hypothetical protein|nr:DUF2293 domain-containing protein [Bosea sp. (in: a-proteobacteria)]